LAKVANNPDKYNVFHQKLLILAKDEKPVAKTAIEADQQHITFAEN